MGAYNLTLFAVLRFKIRRLPQSMNDAIDEVKKFPSWQKSIYLTAAIYECRDPRDDNKINKPPQKELNYTLPL